MAALFHTPEEGKESVRKLKEKPKESLFTEENFEYVTDLFQEHDGKEAEDEIEEKEEYEYDAESDLFYMKITYMHEIQREMTDASFLHGHMIRADDNVIVENKYVYLVEHEKIEVEGMKIETG